MQYGVGGVATGKGLQSVKNFSATLGFGIAGGDWPSSESREWRKRTMESLRTTMTATDARPRRRRRVEGTTAKWAAARSVTRLLAPMARRNSTPLSVPRHRVVVQPANARMSPTVNVLLAIPSRRRFPNAADGSVPDPLLPSCATSSFGFETTPKCIF